VRELSPDEPRYKWSPKTPEEEIERLKQSIIRFEKFPGPIGREMVEALKRRIDIIRARMMKRAKEDPNLR
jgi:hypothetical protein